MMSLILPAAIISRKAAIDAASGRGPLAGEGGDETASPRGSGRQLSPNRSLMQLNSRTWSNGFSRCTAKSVPLGKFAGRSGGAAEIDTTGTAGNRSAIDRSTIQPSPSAMNWRTSRK